MGSNLTIIVYASSETEAANGIQGALECLHDLAKPINNYAPESEVNQLSNLPSNERRSLSIPIWECLSASKRWYLWSDHAFDSTASPIFRTWKEARKTGVSPSEERIRNASLRATWQDIELSEPQVPTPYIQHRGHAISMDLGGLAVGYLLDKMLQELRNDGINSALIDAGGDIVVSEAPPGKLGWTIEIAGIDNMSPILFRKIIKNSAVTTSGDLNQFAVIDGVRYSHIVDPRSCSPVQVRRSVTVIASRCIDADAGATALSVLGPEIPENKLARMPIDEALFLSLDEGSDTPHFREWIRASQ